jgi:hypothetical protein
MADMLEQNLKKKLVIGFGFRKGSGKDTACRLMSSVFTFNTAMKPVIVHFADSLKEGIGKGVFGLTQAQMSDQKEKECVDSFWGLSPRQILQRAGTNAMRKEFSEDIWVKALLRRIANDDDHNVFLVGDVRFPNELEAIQKVGGYVVYLSRIDESEDDQHESETALESHLDKFNYHLLNEETIEELKEGVTTLTWAILAEWQNRRIGLGIY